ncbi:hypothetical protein HYU95_05900 [Candidatus Daviesbacteria bacterium]|nr:hypothetical protein [Candidatus Daviesbacteria bacterium]
MVEVLRERTTAEVIKEIDPEGKRPFTDNVQALVACKPDDLRACLKSPN